MQGAPLTVTQVNEYLRMMLDSDPRLGDLLVRGEISNFTNHYKTGHFYFSLKDETGLIRAVMFRTYAGRLKFVPETGMKVVVHGRVAVFPRDGQYQIYVDDILPDGVGALYLAYEQLRRRLEGEGIFDPLKKKPLPPYPARIGLVTSPTGAAVRDMIQILGRRYPLAQVILYPALVQGPDAPKSLVAGLSCFESKIPVDLIIIGRGGGSMEDLWAFNNEELVRAVAACRTPVISAVGHETDTTLCDFAADLRAPTPSAAAELAVPDQSKLQERITALAGRLLPALMQRLSTARTRVERTAAICALHSPVRAIEERRMTVAFLGERIASLTERKKETSRANFSALCAKMEALNPLRVLSRGFTAVFREDGSGVSRASELSAGERVLIRFEDKIAKAEICGFQESE